LQLKFSITIPIAYDPQELESVLKDLKSTIRLTDYEAELTEPPSDGSEATCKLSKQRKAKT